MKVEIAKWHDLKKTRNSRAPALKVEILELHEEKGGIFRGSQWLHICIVKG